MKEKPNSAISAKKCSKTRQYLEEKWPILAEKYEAYLPDRIIRVMKEILRSNPIDLGLARRHLGNLEKLEAINENLQVDVDITKKLDCSSDLFFLAIRQSIEEQKGFSRYLKCDLKDRIFYLASLRYLEEYSKKINAAFDEWTQLHNTAQNTIGSAKEGSRMANSQRIIKLISGSLPLEDTLIAEFEGYYGNPIVKPSNEETVDTNELIGLLKEATSCYRKISDKNIELHEELETFKKLMQPQTERS